MSWSSGSKCCLTCAHWGGPRSPRLGRPETTSPSQIGKCYGGAYPRFHEGTWASHGTSCSKYVKWSSVK